MCPKLGSKTWVGRLPSALGIILGSGGTDCSVCWAVKSDTSAGPNSKLANAGSNYCYYCYYYPNCCPNGNPRGCTRGTCVPAINPEVATTSAGDAVCCTLPKVIVLCSKGEVKVDGPKWRRPNIVLKFSSSVRSSVVNPRRAGMCRGVSTRCMASLIRSLVPVVEEPSSSASPTGFPN